MKFSEDRHLNVLLGVLFCIPFVQGIYFYHQSYFLSCIFLALLGIRVYKQRTLYFQNGLLPKMLAGIFMGMFYTLFYGVDWGMGILGLLKFLVLPIFILLLLQFDKEKIKDICYLVFAFNSVIMCVLSILLAMIPVSRMYVIYNQRLEGFFQYANTFALWLLVGICIYSCQEIFYKRYIIYIALLTSGIYLTFSRGVMLGGIVFLVLLLLVNRQRWREILLGIALGLILGVGLSYLLNLNMSIERVEETSIHVGEFKTRLLYYRDGMRMILENPLGLGHMGYFYMQRSVQTAVYYVKYIHNGFMQIALDIGIIPMLLLIGYGIYAMLSRHKSKLDKLIIMLIFLHSLIDFNMEYIVIILLTSLTISYKPIKIRVNDFAFRSIYIIITGSILVFSYFGIATFAHYEEQYALSYRLFPYNTENNVRYLRNQYLVSEEKAVQLAEQIIKQNKYVPEAFIIRSRRLESQHQYLSAQAEYKKVIAIKPLDIVVYEEYAMVLKRGIHYYNAQIEAYVDNTRKTEEYLAKSQILAKEILKIPQMLLKTQNRLDHHSYEIKHKPNLAISPIIEESLDIAKDQLKIRGE